MQTPGSLGHTEPSSLLTLTGCHSAAECLSPALPWGEHENMHHTAPALQALPPGPSSLPSPRCALCALPTGSYMEGAKEWAGRIICPNWAIQWEREMATMRPVRARSSEAPAFLPSHSGPCFQEFGKPSGLPCAVFVLNSLVHTPARPSCWECAEVQLSGHQMT